MASRAMYLPLLARLPQDAVTQRMCAAWFQRFPLDTVLELRDAPPEVFDFLIAQVVRVHLQDRRRSMLFLQAIGLLMCGSLATALLYGSWWELLPSLYGFAYLIVTLRKLTPERCAPGFIVRIIGVEVRAEVMP